MRALVIATDGWNAGWLGGYGNEWVSTPHLDRLVAESVVFDQHLADAPDPAAARRVWRSGRYLLPAETGTPPAPNGPDLLALLRENGVRTVLVRNLAREPEADFAEGWDEVVESPEGLTAAVESALDRLEGHDDWFLWIETDLPLPPWAVDEEKFLDYFDALADFFAETETEADLEEAEEVEEEGPESAEPWPEPPEGPFDPDDRPAWRRLHATFAAAVSEIDAELGDLFELLRARGLDGSAAWLLTPAFGYPLGDHGWVGVERPWLHEERVHVPLVLRLPEAVESGRRVPALTSAVDLTPTLLELLGIAPPPEASFHGRSLLPLARGQAEKVRDYAVLGCSTGEALEWALRTPDWYFLLPVAAPPDAAPRGPQLYRKPDDRWEVNDLRQHYLDWLDHVEETLRAFVAASHRPGPLEAPPLREPLENAAAEPGEEGPEASAPRPLE